MHIRLTPVRYVVAHEAAVLRLVREELAPLLHQFPGFLGYLVAGDEEQPGRAILLTRWATAAEAAGVRSALAQLASLSGPFAALGVELDTGQAYAVLLQG